MINIEEFKRKLEEVGEDKISERLASGVYGPKKSPIVKEWLSSKEKKRINTKEQKSLLIAGSAKRAAWIAALAAIIIALIAIVALVWGK